MGDQIESLIAVILRNAFLRKVCEDKCENIRELAAVQLWFIRRVVYEGNMFGRPFTRFWAIH